MKTYEHILVPYNGTAGSEKAFKKAVSLAQLNNSKITVITCLEERPTFGFFKTKTSKKEIERELKMVEKQHSELEKFTQKNDIVFSSKTSKNGLASMQILDFAKKHEVDLIVMTKTKISSTYEKMHYHSTIQNVFRNAPCPILIL